MFKTGIYQINHGTLQSIFLFMDIFPIFSFIQHYLLSTQYIYARPQRNKGSKADIASFLTGLIVWYWWSSSFRCMLSRGSTGQSFGKQKENTRILIFLKYLFWKYAYMIHVPQNNELIRIQKSKFESLENNFILFNSFISFCHKDVTQLSLITFLNKHFALLFNIHMVVSVQIKNCRKFENFFFKICIRIKQTSEFLNFGLKICACDKKCAVVVFKVNIYIILS